MDTEPIDPVYQVSSDTHTTRDSEESLLLQYTSKGRTRQDISPYFRQHGSFTVPSSRQNNSN